MSKTHSRVLKLEAEYVGTVSANKVLAKSDGGCLVISVFPIHRYRCPITRKGKSYGPCKCGASDLYSAWRNRKP